MIFAMNQFPKDADFTEKILKKRLICFLKKISLIQWIALMLVDWLVDLFYGISTFLGPLTLN